MNLLLALAVALAAAEEGDEELSLAQAMDRAARRAPQVLLAEGALREAEASRAGAGVVLPANPRLYGEARSGGWSQGVGGYAAALEAPFEPFGAPAARVVEAGRRAAGAGADLELERYLARFLAFELYAELRMAELRLAEAESAIALAADVETASRRLTEVGASSDIDLAVASATVAELRAGREALLARREEALLPLRELLGLAPGTAVRLTSGLDEPPGCEAPAVAGRDAVAGHPALRAIEARLALGESSLSRLEREVLPRLSLLLGIDAAPNSESYGQLGLGVELPVAQRNQGPRAVASAQLATERTRLELTAQRLLRELGARRAACEARRREAALLGQAAIPAARRALELVEAGWRAGKFDVFRVNAAARDLVRLGQARVDVLGAAWREHVAMQRLAGGGSP